MQLCEFRKVMKGYEDRMEHEISVRSFYIAQLMNIEGKILKKPLKPQELTDCILGKKNNEMSDEEKAEFRNKFAWKFKGKGDE